MISARNLIVSLGAHGGLTEGARSDSEHAGAPLAVLRRTEAGEIQPRLPALFESLQGASDSFCFFVRHRPPPRFSMRVESRVESFAISGDLRPCIAGLKESLLATNPVFEAVQLILAKGRVPSFQVVEYARTPPIQPPPTELGKVDWIIPHRGSAVTLSECLKVVGRVRMPGDVIRVGIDDHPSPELSALSAEHSLAEFHYSPAPGSGPYVMRNRLAAESSENLLFQDSDDFPAFGRSARLLAALRAHPDCAMIGSHELRIDELERAVLPVRYPLDVSGALACGPYYALLHPTAIIRRQAFLDAGGFSTFRVHSMDLQFLFRSHFHFKSRNIDEFAYIRRRHAGSLTTSPGTRNGSWERLRLQNLWADEMKRVQKGHKTVAKSALAATRP